VDTPDKAQSPDASQLELLRRLVIGDVAAATSVVASGRAASALLDGRTAALVRLASVATIGGSATAEQAAVDACRSAGVADTEVAAVLERAHAMRSGPPAVP
jgi:hypothetical protein